MTARLFLNVVYSWVLANAGPDQEARDKVDAQIYAPALGLEESNARLWANILGG